MEGSRKLLPRPVKPCAHPESANEDTRLSRAATNLQGIARGWWLALCAIALGAALAAGCYLSAPSLPLLTSRAKRLLVTTRRTEGGSWASAHEIHVYYADGDWANGFYDLNSGDFVTYEHQPADGLLRKIRQMSKNRDNGRSLAIHALTGAQRAAWTKNTGTAASGRRPCHQR